MTDRLSVPSVAARFLLLGPIAAYAPGTGDPVDLGPDHEQCLLVVLLAAGGKSVPRDRLIKAVWDDTPPEDPTDAVWRLVSRLRRRLQDAGLTDVLKRTGATYRLEVPPEQVDLHRFRAMSAQARRLLGHDDHRAGELLEEALGLHRGVPLAGLKGTWIDAYRHTITEEYHMAEIALYELAIRLGKSRDVVPALTNLLHERPDDESVAWLTMHALYRSGRQGDALAVYREITEHLDRTLAVPSLAALADLHQRMLASDPGLMTADAVTIPFGRSGAPGALPAGDGPAAGGTDAGGTGAEGAGGADADDAQDTKDTARTEQEEPRRGTSVTAQEIGNVAVFEAPVTVHEGFNFTAS
ncbi:AfsR/SARP family transcriptional regulator [Actinoallomurus rhizosphaericola]|uniref:AfsR/SARP family transcriptional regulator n=1 Tax=Actinoallomurus rhizosphaericola TaxID=2952536 RepID=UPI002092F475|nr:AfsR/SARP family transcriptional regulator [Actinoallomurus rhizosphaericola]MCO5995829.1 AfsR/SARP family transcriptional regulator [Actinoallomurus rhizosphaericola]